MICLDNNVAHVQWIIKWNIYSWFNVCFNNNVGPSVYSWYSCHSYI
jgi:hypothetical protein